MRLLLRISIVLAMFAHPLLAQGVFEERSGDVFVIDENNGNQVVLLKDGIPNYTGLVSSRLRAGFDGSYSSTSTIVGRVEYLGLFGFSNTLPGSPSITDAHLESFHNGQTWIALTGSSLVRYRNGTLTTLHDGAPMQSPQAMIPDGKSGFYIADTGPDAILHRSVDGTMSTFAGGSWSDSLVDLGLDRHGNVIALNNGAVRGLYSINQFGGVTTIYQGAPLLIPSGLCVRQNGDFVVTDRVAGIFEISKDGVLATLSTMVTSPVSPLEAQTINGTWIADQGAPGFVLALDGWASTLEPIRTGGPWSSGAPDAIVQDGDRMLIAANDSIYGMTLTGDLTTLHLGFPLTNLVDIVKDARGSFLTCATVGGNGMIWALNRQGVLSTFYDGSQMHNGVVQSASGLEVGPFGEVYVSDDASGTIWRLSPDASTLTTFHASQAIPTPGDLGWHREGLGVAANSQIWAVSPTGTTSSVMYVGSQARSIAGSWRGDLQAIADTYGGELYWLSPDGDDYDSNGLNTTLARSVTVKAPRFDQGDLIIATDEGQMGLHHRWGFQPFLEYETNEFITAITAGTGAQEFAFATTNQNLTTARVVLMTPRGHMPIHIGAPLEEPTGIARDENGGFVVTDRGQTDALYRFAPDGTMQTLHSGAPFVEPWDVTTDVDTGDFIVADFGAGALFRVTRSGQLTTLTSLIATARAVVQDQWDGSFIVGTVGTLRRVARNGSMTTLATGLGLVTDIKFRGDRTLVVTEFGFPSGGGISYYRPNGTAIGASPIEFDEVKAWATGVAYAEKIRGMGNAAIGSEYQLLVDVPGDAGLSYSVMASFTLRPRIPLQGRALVLFPDSLTAASQALPTIFRRFNGTLDGHGSANPSIALPNQAGLVGVRFFVSGLTTELGYGNTGVRTVFNSVGITIR